MKKIFKNIYNIILVLIVLLVLINRNQLVFWIKKNIIYQVPNEIVITNNEYAKKTNYGYIQITDDFFVKNYQQLLNVFYTILDSGNETFTFYCDDSYKECLNDIDKIVPSSNKDALNLLAEINNFVHPFNSYDSVTLTTTDFGKVTVNFHKQYSDEMINYVNSEFDRIEKEIITNEMNNKDKILAFHDYIVNNTNYDSERAKDINANEFKDSLSHTAYGLLTNHLALCSGYSDAMSIYLYRLGINNYKVAGLNHVWNLLYFDDKWTNIDMTWDDPITSNGSSLLLHEYFLISSSELLALDEQEHNADYNIYQEAK